MKDPIVEEVRHHRLEHTRKFKSNLKAICADLRSIQNAPGHKVVRLAPRKLVQKKLSIKTPFNRFEARLKQAHLHSKGDESHEHY
jgi:hypothetical protein